MTHGSLRRGLTPPGCDWGESPWADTSFMPPSCFPAVIGSQDSADHPGAVGVIDAAHGSHLALELDLVAGHLGGLVLGQVLAGVLNHVVAAHHVPDLEDRHGRPLRLQVASEAIPFSFGLVLPAGHILSVLAGAERFPAGVGVVALPHVMAFLGLLGKPVFAGVLECLAPAGAR